MRLFWELTKLSFQRQMTYRAAALAGLATNFFFGLLRAALLQALYGEREVVAGISLAGAITFTGLSQAVIGFLSIFSWVRVMQSVYEGEIAADLLKPMNYFAFWMAQDLGRALSDLLTRGVTMMLAYTLFFDTVHPQNLTGWLAFGVVLFLSWLVSFAWRFLVNLSAFWSPNAIGICRFFFVLSWFLSGFLMPLRYFPDWFIRLCYLTPFPHTVNTPVEVYLGVISGPEWGQAVAGQVAWALALIIAGQWILRAGIRRLVILGG